MKDSFKRIIIKGTLILTLSNFFVSFLNYISNSLSAKSLGPAGFGELSALFAYLNIFSIPITVLTTLVIVKLGNVGSERFEVARKIERWFWSQIFERKILIFLAVSTIIFIPSITNLSPESSITLYVLAALGIVTAFYFSILQGLHKFIAFSLLLVLISVGRYIGTYFSSINSGGILNIYAGLIIGYVIVFLLSKKITNNMLPKNNQKLTITISQFISRKSTLVTSISLLSLALLSNIDIMYVKKMFSAETAGIYSSWSLLAKIVGYFAAPIISASLLFFSAKETKQDHKKLIYILTSIIISVGSIVLIFYQSYTTQVLLLVFSSKFLGIAPFVPFAALFGMLITIITLINNYHVANNSSMALFIPIMIPIYILLMYILGDTIENVISINIGITFFITGILTISLLHL
jgi:O-antigen/teichoic acid export membrane protein